MGELDDTAAPSMDSYFLFSAFSLVVIIIMMNILIAIVSDSCTCPPFEQTILLRFQLTFYFKLSSKLRPLPQIRVLSQDPLLCSGEPELN